MTQEEFKRTRRYMEKKALELMDHEKRNDAVVGVPIQNYRSFHFDDRVFYSVQTGTFMGVCDTFLGRAQDLTPEKFGTKNAKDVIEALRLANPMSLAFDPSSFERMLSHEQCTYVFESEYGEVLDRVLRIDLFREVKLDSEGRPEFIGGLLHTLKHFSRNGVSYSTERSNHELVHPQVLIKEIVEAFFCLDGDFKNPSTYIVLKGYDERYNLKFIFYREENTGVFFLKTVYKVSKRKSPVKSRSHKEA